MSDEHLFHVEGDRAKPARSISLADAGLRERQHLQEWVVANPTMLGDEILIVTMEFDRWIHGAGSPTRDRLDVLGIDPSGTLVVAELKRDDAGDSAELQALRYAAMVSRFDEELLVAAYRNHLARLGEFVTDDEARSRLESHADGPLDPAALRKPRIVLMAGSFRPTTTASAVWLTEMGIDVTLIRYQAYSTGDEIVLTTSQLWPIADIEDFTVRPTKAERQRTETAKSERRRSGSWIARLVEDAIIEPGTLLTFDARNGRGPSRAVRDQVAAWVEEHPELVTATWTGANPRALRRVIDDSEHSTSGLAQLLVEEATGTRYSLPGPQWWTDESGRTLSDIYSETYGVETPGGRDWSDLHSLLAELEPGEWTAYQDLAEAIGTAAQPVGNHVAQCPECPTAYRVLTSEGVASAGFRWDDPTDARDPIEVLIAEGVRFREGRADQTQRRQWAKTS
jgi:alkylated DNA nucleotide flippase Atl1